jgi:RNA polymerase sigma-70 factor, ECF subfamily
MTVGDSQSAGIGFGSEQEIGDLLERYRDYLLAIAGQELPTQLAAKVGASDLVQETIAIGYQQFDTFRGTSTEQLARWLRTILLNHLRNVVDSYATARQDVSRELVSDLEAIHELRPSPSRQVVLQEEWDQLQAALSRLQEEFRRVVLLRHRENLSFEEIGRVLSRSEATARRIWIEAVRQLQREMQTDDSRVC